MLVYDQGIDSLLILASHSDEDITMICYVIRRPGGVVGSKARQRESNFCPTSKEPEVYSIHAQNAGTLGPMTLDMSTAHLC